MSHDAASPTSLPLRHVQSGHVASSRKHTVLVIDDEDHVRHLARQILQSEGYGVLTARDGLDGLIAFKRRGHSIAAIVLDADMPGMGRADIIRSMRKIKPNVRILLSSGGQAASEFRDAELRPSGYLPKPYRAQALLAAIRSLIEA